MPQAYRPQQQVGPSAVYRSTPDQLKGQLATPRHVESSVVGQRSLQPVPNLAVDRSARRHRSDRMSSTSATRAAGQSAQAALTCIAPRRMLAGNASCRAQAANSAASHCAPVRHSAIQPMMLSSAWSSVKESYYGLTEQEMSKVRQRKPIDILFAPVHGSFTAHDLTVDLHVSAADPNQNVQGKLNAALKKAKALMEFAADVHGLNVNKGKIVMRPTGGVVVKQMVELLAFLGLGMFEKMSLNEKVEMLKTMRKARVQSTNAKISAIKQKRDARLKKEGLDVVLEARKQLPKDYEPSPGFAKLLSRAEAIQGEPQGEIDELISITGERTGSYMGEAFFDEHAYLLQSLIGRGGQNTFTVSAYGLVNELPQDSPEDIEIIRQIAQSENALLLTNDAGQKAREVYMAKLRRKAASLSITIYYGQLGEVIKLTS
ncbi:MAG TPA: hypothetical protein VKE96_23240 [Vicinamibacterales bacterium]|nr:hypothetical protein [Vicinamibacterales bacterium]